MSAVEDLLAQISTRMERVAAQSAAALECQKELATLKGVASSARGEVTVTVDHRGMVMDLEFTDDALDLGPEQLSTVLIQTTQDAIADLQAQAVPIRNAYLPDRLVVGADPSIDEQFDALYERMGGSDRGGAGRSDRHQQTGGYDR